MESGEVFDGTVPKDLMYLDVFSFVSGLQLFSSNKY